MSTNLTVVHFISFQIFFFTLENLMSAMEVKNYGRKSKDESLISSFPWKSSCKRITHQTVKLKDAVKFQ